MRLRREMGRAGPRAMTSRLEAVLQRAPAGQEIRRPTGRGEHRHSVAEVAEAAREAGHVLVDIVRLRPGERRDQADAQAPESSPLPTARPGKVPAPVAVRSPAQEEKRRRILEAAVRAFARKGYHACRVGEIATEAGVAYGLVYHYFTSKDEILETIFRETWAQMLTAIEAVEEEGVPAGEQLRKVAAIVLRTWKRDPDLVRVLVREVTRSQHIQREVEEIEHAYAALQRIVQRGQDSGEFRD